MSDKNNIGGVLALIALVVILVGLVIQSSILDLVGFGLAIFVGILLRK